jgi:hypothetical protein
VCRDCTFGLKGAGGQCVCQCKEGDRGDVHTQLELYIIIYTQKNIIHYINSVTVPVLQGEGYHSVDSDNIKTQYMSSHVCTKNHTQYT